MLFCRAMHVKRVLNNKRTSSLFYRISQVFHSKQPFQRSKMQMDRTNHEETVATDVDATLQHKLEEEDEGKEEEEENQQPVPLMALNHVSRLCNSVQASVDFYTKVLGFVLVNRPPAFDFDGAWLFNYGIGIHLLQKKEDSQQLLDASPDRLDPMDNHISFQCEDMEAMEQRLKDKNIEYLKRTIGDTDRNKEKDNKTSLRIDQLFFNDPDGFMIEICNCENVKLIPQQSFGRISLPDDRHVPPVALHDEDGGQVQI